MATQKWCNVAGCKKFIFATLDDLSDDGWTAYQIGKKKSVCYCPDHLKECKEDMKKELLK